MKDLADDYAGAICDAAAALAAEHAEISMRQAATLERAAEAAKAAIDETAAQGRAALERYRAASDAAHRAVVMKMNERAREFLGIKPELAPPPAHTDDDQGGAAPPTQPNSADPHEGSP